MKNYQNVRGGVARELCEFVVAKTATPLFPPWCRLFDPPYPPPTHTSENHVYATDTRNLYTALCTDVFTIQSFSKLYTLCALYALFYRCFITCLLFEINVFKNGIRVKLTFVLVLIARSLYFDTDRPRAVFFKNFFDTIR